MKPCDHIAILAVSKQRRFAKAMRTLLRNDETLDITSFANTKALALISTAHCAVVLLDAASYSQCQLNDMARALRQQTQTVKMIAVFPNNLSPAILSHVEAGIMGFYFCDEPADKLAQIIRGAYEGRAYISADIAGQLIKRISELHTCHKLCGRTVEALSSWDMQRLSRREQEVFDLVGQGMSNRQIADRLIIEHGTVKNHVHKVFKKLRVDNRQEAANLYALIANQVEPGRPPYMQ